MSENQRVREREARARRRGEAQNDRSFRERSPLNNQRNNEIVEKTFAEEIKDDFEEYQGQGTPMMTSVLERVKALEKDAKESKAKIENLEKQNTDLMDKVVKLMKDVEELQKEKKCHGCNTLLQGKNAWCSGCICNR